MFDNVALLQPLQNGHFFFHSSRWCHFLNIGCFLSRFLHRITILLLSRCFCMLLALKSSNSEETVFFHLFLACYTLRKMANFTTFQNRVTLLMLSGFEAVFPIKHLMCVYGHFLYYSWSSKFIPKVGHFWRFRLTTAFTKWQFLPPFKMMSFFLNI